MKRSDIYESNWIKSQDMLDQGLDHGLNLTISAIETNTMDDGREQRVLSFKESDKRLGLNATNWDSIAAITGEDDDDNWIGTCINVYPHKLDRPYMGKTHGIRVRAVQGSRVSRGAAAPKVTAEQIAAGRKAAFEALKAQLPPGTGVVELKKAWLEALGKMFPGRRQIELTLADWQKFKSELEGYAGEPDPAAAAFKDDDIPF